MQRPAICREQMRLCRSIGARRTCRCPRGI
jgi:hypothetical protein